MRNTYELQTVNNQLTGVWTATCEIANPRSVGEDDKTLSFSETAYSEWLAVRKLFNVMFNFTGR